MNLIRSVITWLRMRRAARRSKRDNTLTAADLERHAEWLRNLKSNDL